MNVLETLSMTWTGVTPFVPCNVRMADPFNVYCERLNELSSIPQKKRTKEQQWEIFKAQWEGYLYFDEKLGPVLPGQNIEACLREGAAKLKMKKDILERLEVDEVHVALEYKGPRDLDRLWNSKTPSFKDVRIVGKSGSAKRPICRPIFPQPWAATFTVVLDDIRSQQVFAAAEQAGRFVGVGTHRCFKWGRFLAAWTKKD